MDANKLWSISDVIAIVLKFCKKEKALELRLTSQAFDRAFFEVADQEVYVANQKILTIWNKYKDSKRPIALEPDFKMEDEKAVEQSTFDCVKTMFIDPTKGVKDYPYYGKLKFLDTLNFRYTGTNKLPVFIKEMKPEMKDKITKLFLGDTIPFKEMAEVQKFKNLKQLYVKLDIAEESENIVLPKLVQGHFFAKTIADNIKCPQISAPNIKTLWLRYGTSKGQEFIIPGSKLEKFATRRQGFLKTLMEWRTKFGFTLKKLTCSYDDTLLNYFQDENSRLSIEQLDTGSQNWKVDKPIEFPQLRVFISNEIGQFQNVVAPKIQEIGFSLSSDGYKNMPQKEMDSLKNIPILSVTSIFRGDSDPDSMKKLFDLKMPHLRLLDLIGFSPHKEDKDKNEFVTQLKNNMPEISCIVQNGKVIYPDPSQSDDMDTSED